MTRMLRWASVLATLVLLVVACTGPGASPTTAPTGTPGATPTTAATTPPAASTEPTGSAEPTASGAASPSPSPSPTAPPGAVEGTLTIWADTVRTPILKAVGADFTAQTQVPVQVYEIGFGDIRDRLATLGGHDAGPDIIIGAHDWLGKLVAAGVVEPLDLTDKADQFLQVGLDAFTYDGQLYGLPYVSEAVALFYNTDLVPEAPTTWAELKAKAKELQDAGTVTQGYCLQNGDPYHSYPILTGFGGYIFGKDATTGAYDPTDVGLDSPGGLAYAAELDSMVKEGLLRNNVAYGDCTTLMTTGKAAFWITGPWALNDFNKASCSQPEPTAGATPAPSPAVCINFAVAPIPAMEDTPRPFVGVQGFMVNSFAPNKLLAETFLKDYIATDDTMRTLWEADPRLPVWKQLADQMDDPNIVAFTESATNGDPMPAIPQMDSVWKSWTDAINIVFGQTYTTAAPDAATVFEGAATQIRGLIGQ